MNFPFILLITGRPESVHWIPFEYSYIGGRRTRHKTTITGGKKEYKAEISGWRGEIFIPFKLLRPLKNVPPKSGTRWKANFYRVDFDHSAAYWSWKPFDETFHDLDQYA